MINPFRRRTPFVNEGPDPRIEGPLGEMLARAQRQTMRYSVIEPNHIVIQRGAWGHFIISDPFFFSLFLKRVDGNWWSVRFGMRFDPNVGDGHNPKEPVHNPPGAYFFDIILKPNIDKEVLP